MNPSLENRLDALPDRPGVYRFLDPEGKVLYVGKARSLRSRVRSYFQPSARHSPRIERMVGSVADVDVIVVDTETEAVMLESNLIKRHRPPFNVVLRDDKHFPYLKLSIRDEYPRVSLVRRARLDGNLYFGPYTPASVARRSLKLIPRFFQVATCKEVFDGRRRPCLYYHLDQCLAPCAGKTTPEAYGRAVEHARLFLEGRHRELEVSLEAQMREASGRLEFERAARLRDTLRTVRKLSEKQHMVSVKEEEQDVLAHHEEGGQAALEIFQIREGRVQGRREFFFDALDWDAPSVYASVLGQHYADAPPPREILLPAEPEDAGALEAWLAQRRGGRVRLRVPKRGEARKFLEMVARNAALAFKHRFRSAHTHGVEALEALAEVLRLEESPGRIECFDVSNFQGTDAVASMVVWEGGRSRKSDYRIYKIRGVQGPDDFASIAEVVLRRYRRLLQENRRLPDLVLIDGGAGQLGAAVRSLAQVGLPMLPVVALAKREEEIYLQQDGEPLRLDRSHPALQLLQRIRDEAHRFAVIHHRRQRRTRTLKTELTAIEGVGQVTAKKLLRTFGSVRGVRDADPDALRKVAGRKVAEAIARYYTGESEGT